MADPTGINKVGDVADVGSDPANTRGDPDTMATMRHRMQMGMAALSDSREDETRRSTVLWPAALTTSGSGLLTY
jgi:hypothetical protein